MMLRVIELKRILFEPNVRVILQYSVILFETFKNISNTLRNFTFIETVALEIIGGLCLHRSFSEMVS